jgi:hypothetical protein
VTQVEAIVERLVRDFQSFLVVLSGPGALIVVPDDREHPTVPLDLSIEGERVHVVVRLAGCADDPSRSLGLQDDAGVHRPGGRDVPR